jgi:hypothetical protein
MTYHFKRSGEGGLKIKGSKEITCKKGQINRRKRESEKERRYF